MNLKTARGNKNLSLSNIYLILENTFYYGVFEYPKKSGNWYTGIHKPLTTKELYNLVQDQVKSNILRVENKEFAFTKLMNCGICGSGISADEKFKKLKNGGINRHVYYGCTRSKDRNCKGGYINEKDLIKQFQKLIEGVKISEKSMRNKIKEEVSRIKKFNQLLLGIEQDISVSSIDIQNYAKFILKEGSIDEKRELLGCLHGRIVLRDKELKLE
jgi:hypothetical protein